MPRLWPLHKHKSSGSKVILLAPTVQLEESKSNQHQQSRQAKDASDDSEDHCFFTFTSLGLCSVERAIS